MRAGFSLSFAHDSIQPTPFTESTSSASGGQTSIARHGWTGRAGAIFAMGAPWVDKAVGLALEGGIAAGGRSGTTLTESCTPSSSERMWCIPSATRAVSTRETFASPYASIALVLQVPTRLPLNLWTSTSAEWTALYYGSSQLFFVFRLGVSWRAL